MPFVKLVDSESEEAQLRSERIRKPGACYLSDGISKVDYVLVFDPDETEGVGKRAIFEEQLRKTGFRLERVQADEKRGGLMFVKISAPWGVLSTYAEVLHFKMPIRKHYAHKGGKKVHCPETATSSSKAKLGLEETILRKPAEILAQKHLTLSFLKTREYLFNVPDVKEEFFSGAQRSQIVNFILHRKPYSKKGPRESFDFGIDRLLNDGTYLAAYPLHEGSAKVDDNSPRQKLLASWASMSSVLKPQPLDDIRSYFGVKVGLYFAWLGFYSYMLLFPAILGTATFIYGIITANKFEPNREVCNRFKDFVMCPTCDKGCEYWFLGESCTQAMLAYLFDNGATVCFTVFIACWSAAFLELWKRYSCRITYLWDLSGFDTLGEVTRPAYVAEMVLSHRNQEPNRSKNKPSRWIRKLPQAYFGLSMLLLLILLVFATVFGIYVYRTAYRFLLELRGGEEYSSTTLVNSGAAFLNMTAFLTFNTLYSKLAVKLTDLEMPRTQSEYDDSLTFKIFLLQFIGCYATTFYIAIHKNRFKGVPGKHNFILKKYQQETCGYGGCFQEISTSLAVLMVGSQLFSALYSFLWPKIVKTFQNPPEEHVSEESSSASSKSSTYLLEKMIKNGAAADDEKPWERDFCLPDLGQMGLFNEYLDMIIQFGFVTLFVTAFPLAPVFALVSNIFEIRLRAKKLLLSVRRPVGQRVKDIGVPYTLMQVVSKLSVVTNAGIIAFTSEFVPRMFYRMHYSPNENLVGYVNFTLSYFNTSHYDKSVVHHHRERLGNSTYCRYWDYRAPPWSKIPYKRSNIYWEIFVWRLLFVILFENAVVVLIALVCRLIPATPKSIQHRIKEDNRLAKKMIVRQELQRRRSMFGNRDSRTRATFGSAAGARVSSKTAGSTKGFSPKRHPKRD